MPEKKPVTKRRPTTAKKPRAPKKTAVKSTSAHVTVEKEAAVVRPKPKTHRTYLFAVGRRKSAIARVRLYDRGEHGIVVNGLAYTTYFPIYQLQKIVHEPLEVTSTTTGEFTIKVHGGGKHGQAEAARLGISRVLEKRQRDLRTTLKRAGFLTRDPRVKERKKYGLKRARRAPQWQKR